VSPATALRVLLLGALACAPGSEPERAAVPLAACVPEQRDRICTLEYDPVCAALDTGVRCVTVPCPSSEWKTYSNACSACSDARVTGHQPGACP
jgi:hypothetical protein